MSIKIPFYSEKEFQLFIAFVKNEGKELSLISDFYISYCHLWFIASLLIQFRVLLNSSVSLKNIQSMDSIRTYNSLLIAKNPFLNKVLCWIAIRKAVREGRFRNCDNPTSLIWDSYNILSFDRGGPASGKGTPDFKNEAQRLRYLRGVINSFIGELQTQPLVSKRSLRWTSDIQSSKSLTIDEFWKSLLKMEDESKEFSQDIFKDQILELLSVANLHFQDTIEPSGNTTPLEQWLGITRELVPSPKNMMDQIPENPKKRSKEENSLNILLGNLD
ncbi:hypothetical protein [Escherichia coli]|uniref:hypothetical protein n=1 Tax=Escherichia coli TaxID=562 RepID=UPI003B9C5189